MILVLARRLANVVPTLVAVIALVFLLFSVLPGSFISGMGEDGRTAIDPAVMERMRKEMGLDDPLPERFAKYVAHTVVGDLGTSFRTKEPVTRLIAGRPSPSRSASRWASSPRLSPAAWSTPCRWSAPSRACRCRSSGSA